MNIYSVRPMFLPFSRRPVQSTVARTPLTSLFSLCVAAALLAASAAQAEATDAEATGDKLVQYTVQQGDTLIGLGKRMLKKADGWQVVARLNRLSDVHRITPGQRLLVPSDILEAQQQAATVVQSVGEVRILDAAGKPVQGSSVAEGQQLQTGSNGSAVVQLQDGSRFKVLPDSAIRLAVSRNYLKNRNTPPAAAAADWFSGVIRVINGALEANVIPSADKATPTRVQTPTAVVGVRGTEFRVRYAEGKNQNSAVEVTGGLVTADNIRQASRAEVQGGYGAVIDPLQKKAVVRQLLPAIAPEGMPAVVTRQHESGRALWSFTGLEQAKSYRLQIARDAEQQQIIKTIESEGTTIDVSALEDGLWHFNLRAVDTAGLSGLDSQRAVRLATVPPTPTPTPVPTPIPLWTERVAENTYLEWNGNYNAATLAFTLAGAWQPQAAHIEVADNPQMRGAATYISTGNHVRIGQLLANRTYYLLFSDARGNTSRVYRIHIPLAWGQKSGFLRDVLKAEN